VTHEPDPEALAKAIVDTNLYMVLGTADEAGRPWVSPVYYAHAPAAHGELFWVSSPETTHSRNIAARPEISIVIFDSRVPIGAGRGVYMKAIAEKLTGSDVERGIQVFSRRSQEHGGDEWTLEEVRPPARLRLYRAVASEHSVLGPHDERLPVTL
jgi:uncharacterized protein YhbP (UPF0306 family)